MDLTYALRGELITLLNKRLMTNDQLNFEAAIVVS